jgi:hypothetical protein
MRSSLLALAVPAALSLLTTSLTAQIQTFGGTDADRKACTLFLAEVSGKDHFNLKGGAAINYSQPTWKDSYNADLESGKFNNQNARLGANWWTSFDTYTTIDFAGTKVAPGSYFLGMHVDKDGKFSLMFLDSKRVLTSGWSPLGPQQWQTDVMAPLTLAKNSLKETVTKMEITITANKDNPSMGKFSIKWGKHELSADLKFQIEGAKDATAPKK